jgi:5-formyltetrahydrofolate cyclo-ligase
MVNPSATNQISVRGDKFSLRKALRAARNRLSIQDQAAAGEGLLRHLQMLPEFLQSSRVALYLANDGEIDPAKVMWWIVDNERTCFLPVVQQQDNRNSLLFAEVNRETRLVDNGFGIAEPDVIASDLTTADELDLVLLPLVGFDHRGNRIGMGGGFYDTTFEFLKSGDRHKPLLVGVAHEMQKVDRINAESWDIPLSTVVTDQSIYRLGD